MSLKINQAMLFEEEILADPVSRLDCLLFNKLLGVPVTHYRLWKASRLVGVDKFLKADQIPHSVKQQAISQFEMAWEQVQTLRSPHQDLVMPMSLALAFVQAQNQCDRDEAELVLKRYKTTALQARKWMLNRVAEFISAEDSQSRIIGQGLLSTISQFTEAFNESLESDLFHIQMNYLPQERVRLAGCTDLSQQNNYDICTITTLLGCFMHGPSIGFVTEKYGFIDYARLVFPSMRVIDKSCFNDPRRLNLPTTVTLTQQYGIEVNYKPKSHRVAQRPQYINPRLGVYQTPSQDGIHQRPTNGPSERHILNQTASQCVAPVNSVERCVKVNSRNGQQSQIKSYDLTPMRALVQDAYREQPRHMIDRQVQARLDVYQNCEAYPFGLLYRKRSINTLLKKLN